MNSNDNFRADGGGGGAGGFTTPTRGPGRPVLPRRRAS
jgi:hypothetical protein